MKNPMQRETPLAVKMVELKLVCGNDATAFNKACNDCLDENRLGGAMLTYEPMGMSYIKKEGDTDLFFWQVFAKEEKNVTLEPDSVSPEKVKELHFVKTENVDEFNSELQFCIDNNFLIADPVRVNLTPDRDKLIFTAMFIKTEKQMIIQPSQMTQIN